MRLGPFEILLIVAVILLIFGTSRFDLLKISFSKAAQSFNRAVKGESKE
jgi:Sec-independent protein translocase protein TatA